MVADIWSFFDSKHELSIDMATIKVPTMFADYRVPQVLNHFNALVYSKTFLDKLEKMGKTYYFLSISLASPRSFILRTLYYVHKNYLVANNRLYNTVHNIIQ